MKDNVVVTTPGDMSSFYGEVNTSLFTLFACSLQLNPMGRLRRYKI